MHDSRKKHKSVLKKISWLPLVSMLQYFIRRILIAVPTIIIISVVAFLLGQTATDDPVSLKSGAVYQGNSKDPEAEAAFIRSQANNFHLNKPTFYFTITNSSFPDTLYKIFPEWRKDKMIEMATACGKWAPVEAYEKWLSARVRDVEALPDSIMNRTAVNALIAEIKPKTSIAACDTLWEKLSDNINHPPFREKIAGRSAYLAALMPEPGWGWPKFYWYGIDNQYHDWLIGRYSKEDGSPWKKILYPLRVTLFINVTAILLSLMVGVATGVFFAGRTKRSDAISKRMLIVIYVVPLVLIGCLFRYLFATSGVAFYNSYTGGIGTSVYDPSVQSFGAWVVKNQGKLILPVITLFLHLFALIALQMRTGMVNVLQMDFIRTARAKGLPEDKVRWRHALPNALFPVITIAGHLLPFAVGGSVIVEVIFNIHGMGYALLDAFYAKDFSVLMSIVLIAAVLTIAGNLLSDLMYAWIDPRVTYV